MGTSQGFHVCNHTAECIKSIYACICFTKIIIAQLNAFTYSYTLAINSYLAIGNSFLLLSADNYLPLQTSWTHIRTDRTLARSGFKSFDTLIVFLKDF